jgi:hypothetical protein
MQSCAFVVSRKVQKVYSLGRQTGCIFRAFEERPMRRILIFFAMIFCLVCGADGQASSVATGWQQVLLLKAGTSMHVTTTAKKSTTCKMESVDDQALTCKSGSKQDVTFQRAEIKTIKLDHRRRSALVGFAVGAGVGAGIGAGVGFAEDRNGWFQGLAIGVGAAAGGIVGALVGVAVAAPTDMTAGAPIYKAP